METCELNENEKLYILPEKTGALHHLKRDPEDKYELVKVKLIKKVQITHDTYILTFELPNDMYLGLNLGHHIAIQ